MKNDDDGPLGSLNEITVHTLKTWALRAALAAVALPGLAHADALDQLRGFVRDTKFGRADFTQTVTAPDGIKKKTSTGTFEFSRPNRFRFVYQKPYAQTIVGDGQKVWFYDVDLAQVTVRKMGDALGATPAAVLAGQGIERDFELKAEPDRDGLQWVLATPKQSEGQLQWLRVGFKGTTLAALEIADSFGQRSMLKFNAIASQTAPAPETFKFTVPAGVDVTEP